MTVIKIESGCYQIKGEPETNWMYSYTDSEGIHNIPFLVPPGETPEIGDFIENGVLVKKEGPQVNPDTSKWKDKMWKFYGNP